jgi:peptide/nickel transport system substrate-binding protein
VREREEDVTEHDETSIVSSLNREVLEGRLTRREALRRASLLGLSATALAGLGAGTPTRSASALPARQDGEPVRGGTVRVGIPGSAATFDPNVAIILEAIWPCELLYSSLVRINSDMEIEPDLALSWESNDAADEWTFQLREGVTWHDGEDFSSEDVVATMERILDPDLASAFRANILMIEEMETPSAMEIVFRLSEPYAEFPELMSNYQARITPAGRSDGLEAAPIGTGPYVLADHVPGERTVLRRFDGYFDAENQGFLDEIQYLAIPEEATKSAALTSGGIELANEFLPTTLPTIEGAPGITTTEIITGGHQPIAMDVTQEPFDDVRVRTALKLCAERDGFLAVVLQGHGETAADQPVPSVDPMYGAIPIPAQDIQRAQELLAEAGYPDGIDLTLQTSSGRPGMQESAIAFKDMAAAANIRIEIVSHPVDNYWADIWKKTPFFTTNWTGRPTAEQMMSLLYLCDSPGTEGKWCNEDFDALMAEARRATDADERRNILTEAQQLLADEGPVLIPYFRSYITAFTSRLHGFQAHPLRFLDLRRAWLEG